MYSFSSKHGGMGRAAEFAKLYFMLQVNWHRGISMGASYPQTEYKMYKRS